METKLKRWQRFAIGAGLPVGILAALFYIWSGRHGMRRLSPVIRAAQSTSRSSAVIRLISSFFFACLRAQKAAARGSRIGKSINNELIFPSL